MGKMILVTGGTASGKSAFGETLLSESCKGDKLYLATMSPYGEEGKQRIEKHRKMREGKHFVTAEVYEQSLSEVAKQAEEYEGVLFECLSNYVTNCMFTNKNQNVWPNEEKESCLVSELFSEIGKLSQSTELLVVMSAELFSDGVKYDAGTESFIRVLAACNRMLAENADEVYEVICGIPKRRK